MSLRMLLINPLGTEIFDQITVDLVRPHLSPDTDVVCRSLGDAVPRTPYLAPASAYHDPLVGAVRAAADEGFDVVGISCCGDPALQDCKAASRIPVTAPIEAMAATSHALGPVCVVQRKLPPAFAAEMPTQRDGGWLRELVRSYGVADSQVSFRDVLVDEHPSPEVVADMVIRDPDGLRELILDAMARCADGSGAEVARDAAADGTSTSVFFACTFWGGLLDGVRNAAPITVLDPLVVVAKYAEYLGVVA
jgi:Asp/Glu/hydantoin racemase